MLGKKTNRSTKVYRDKIYFAQLKSDLKILKDNLELVDNDIAANLAIVRRGNASNATNVALDNALAVLEANYKKIDDDYDNTEKEYLIELKLEPKLSNEDIRDNIKIVDRRVLAPGSVMPRGERGVVIPGVKPPREFPAKVKRECWNKAKKISNYDEDLWRADVYGNPVFKPFRNCNGVFCYDLDHVVPYANGGLNTNKNCVVLQSTMNKSKQDDEDKVWVKSRIVPRMFKTKKAAMDFINDWYLIFTGF